MKVSKQYQNSKFNMVVSAWKLLKNCENHLNVSEFPYLLSYFCTLYDPRSRSGGSILLTTTTSLLNIFLTQIFPTFFTKEGFSRGVLFFLFINTIQRHKWKIYIRKLRRKFKKKRKTRWRKIKAFRNNNSCCWHFK